MLPYTFQKVMMAELRHVGYDEAKVLPGQYIQPSPHLPVTITDTRVTAPAGFHETPEFAKIMVELRSLHKLAGEATWLFENTPDSRSKALSGQKQFTMYMNTMMTACFNDKGEPEYTVRTREYDGSLTKNCRLYSYMDAKVNFLFLSHMLNTIPAFDTNHLDQMHKALIYRATYDAEMTPKEHGMVHQAITAMERTFPGFAEPPSRSEPELTKEQDEDIEV